MSATSVKISFALNYLSPTGTIVFGMYEVLSALHWYAIHRKASNVIIIWSFELLPLCSGDL